MRRIGTLALLLPGLLAAADAAASCRASLSGSHSFDTRVSPGSGGFCRMTVDVFEGRACGPPSRWHALLPCDQAQHTAISNNGRLISILTPLAKRRELNAVRVTWSAEKWAWATLDKLAGGKPFKGPVRLSFEGDALKLTADRTVVIPFETVRHLASAMGD